MGVFSIYKDEPSSEIACIVFKTALELLAQQIDDDKANDFDKNVKLIVARLVKEEKLMRYFMIHHCHNTISYVNNSNILPALWIDKEQVGSLVESLEAFTSNISSFDYMIKLDNVRCLFSDLGGLFGWASIALIIVFFIVLFVVAVGPNAHSLTTSPPFVLNFFSIAFCSSLGLSAILFGCSWMADGLIARESSKIIDNKYDAIGNNSAYSAKISNRDNVVASLLKTFSSEIHQEVISNISPL